MAGKGLKVMATVTAASVAGALVVPAAVLAVPVPPTVTITTAPASLSSDNTPTVGFSTSDVVTVECAVVPAGDPPAFAACTSPYRSGALADGDWEFTVQVTDAGGLVATDSHPFTVDTQVAAPVVDAQAVAPSHVELSWQPVDDGAAPVTYDVLRNGAVIAGAITDTAYDDRWAPPGSELTYGVRATDDLGNVGDTTTVIVTTAAAQLPDAPTDVSLAADGRRATVTWAAPADTGGTWLDDYRVTLTEQGTGVVFTRYVHRLNTSTTFTGLRRGGRYRASVSAANSVGSGPVAVSLWLQLVYTPPAAPQMSEAASGSPRDGRVTAAVAWDAPDSSDGVPVTGYRVTAVGEDGRRRSAWVGSTARTAEIGWLTAGVTYRFYVQAGNRAGLSNPSDWSNAVPAR